jgi:hypothetical protein
VIVLTRPTAGVEEISKQTGALAAFPGYDRQERALQVALRAGDGRLFRLQE